MRVQTLIEFIDAAVQTHYVSGPFDERGGIMLVGYPGALKTTIIKAAIEPHTDAIVLSDMNAAQWLKIQDDFVTHRFRTIGFTDFEKVYQRHSSVASHVEGIVKALVAEGYGIGPNGDQRMPAMPAQAIVAAAMTHSCFQTHYDEWQKNGFLRRFLWLLIAVQNPEAITRAIRDWKKLDFGRIHVRPANANIEPKLPDEISDQLEKMMKYQAGSQGTAAVLLKKIAVYLLWKYKGKSKQVIKILSEISPALGKHGGRIVL